MPGSKQRTLGLRSSGKSDTLCLLSIKIAAAAALAEAGAAGAKQAFPLFLSPRDGWRRDHLEVDDVVLRLSI